MFTQHPRTRRIKICLAIGILFADGAVRGFTLAVFSFFLFRGFEVPLNFTGDWSAKLLSFSIWVVPLLLGGIAGWLQVKEWKLFAIPLLTFVSHLLVFFIMVVIGAFMEGGLASLALVLFIGELIITPAGVILIIFCD